MNIGTLDRLRSHWPEYLIEAWALGMFMVSAGLATTLVEYPDSWLHQAVADPLLRRALVGILMGLTATALIHSPWGQRSGAHMNPAVTLAYWSQGKVRTADAGCYVLAQCVGGTLGVLAVLALCGHAFSDPPVRYIATLPGVHGVLVALYIMVEAPLSGMSMNPARSLASAIPARLWSSLWLYFTAPVIGMLAGVQLLRVTHGRERPHWAKLLHPGHLRCIHCGQRPLSPTGAPLGR